MMFEAMMCEALMCEAMMCEAVMCEAMMREATMFESGLRACPDFFRRGRTFIWLAKYKSDPVPGPAKKVRPRLLATRAAQNKSDPGSWLPGHGKRSDPGS